MAQKTQHVNDKIKKQALPSSIGQNLWRVGPILGEPLGVTCSFAFRRLAQVTSPPVTFQPVLLGVRGASSLKNGNEEDFPPSCLRRRGPKI